MWGKNQPVLLRPPLREGTEDGGGKPRVFTPPPTPLRETGTEQGRSRDGGDGAPCNLTQQQWLAISRSLVGKPEVAHD